MTLVDPDLSRLEGQIIYLDFDGAQNVVYHGPVEVGPFDVPAFSATAIGGNTHDTQTAADITRWVAEALAPLGVIVTNQIPQQELYSTIFVGGSGQAFADYGQFDGLAESVDVGNIYRDDAAFVFSEVIRLTAVPGQPPWLSIANVVAHEAGHLLGFAHADGFGDVAVGHGLANPFFEVAHHCDDDVEVHQWIAKEAYDLFVAQFSGSELGSYLTKPELTPSSPWSTLADASREDHDNNILEGTWDEDQAYRNPFGQLMPYLRHFCKGGDGSELYDGLAGYDSAFEQALRYWQSYVVDKYSSSKGLSYYYLGHVVHLLQDMTVPAHVHNDQHGVGDDEYEDWVAESNHFQNYHSTSCAPGWSILLPASLESLFQLTADYTEDYPSDDYWGDKPAEYGASYRAPNRHQPGAITSVFDLTASECLTIANDLVPWAIEQTASLFRYFYSVVDTTPPTVSLSGLSTDVNNPTPFVSTSIQFTASANDLQSGIDIDGYHFYTADWDGSWSDWYDRGASVKNPTLTLSEGLHAVYVSAENGGGRHGNSSVYYFRIDTLPPMPNPSTWATSPYATGDTSIRMVATIANDPNGVQYYFDETSGHPGGSDSGWQDSPVYEDTGLAPYTTYSYQVITRDKSPNQNTGSYSSLKSATTTDSAPPTGSVSIAPAVDFDGDSTTLDTASIRITPLATDNSGSVASMRFSYDGVNWEGWKPYSASPFNQTLPQEVINAASGQIQLFAQYRDAAGNASGSYVGSISVSISPVPLVVTGLQDTVASDGSLALREAILLSALRPGEAVTFAPALYAGGPATITLGGAELTISSGVTIEGPGAELLTISANGQSRVFHFAESVTATIEGLTITGGFVADWGGGIINWGTLTISNATIVNNSTSTSSYYDGGGISNSGTLHIVDSLITNNYANGNESCGGGVCNYGNIVIERSIITGNQAREGFGGGVCNYYGIMTISKSTISDNVAASGGGIGNAPKPGRLTIDNSLISGNSAWSGGGIFNLGELTIVSTVVRCNTAWASWYWCGGGGINNYSYTDDSNGSLSLVNSTVASNVSGTNGGGIRSWAWDDAVQEFVPSEFSAVNSIIALNAAPESGEYYGVLSSNSSHNLTSGDPQFVRNPCDGGDGWGDDPTTPEIDESANDDFGDLRLAFGSLGIDTGSNALAVDADGNPLVTDFLGNPRIQNEIVDIGAYEFDGVPPEVVDMFVDSGTPLAICADDTFTEPRSGGVTRLLVAFSEPIDPASWSAAGVQIAGTHLGGSPVDLSSMVVMTSLQNGNTVGMIEFSTALPDVAKYAVRISGVADLAGNALAGDNDRVFAALKGDVSGDGVVNAVDLARVRANNADPISTASAAQIRADLSLDGRVDSLDLSWVRAHVGGDVRGIEAPVLPPVVPPTVLAAEEAVDGPLVDAPPAVTESSVVAPPDVTTSPDVSVLPDTEVSAAAPAEVVPVVDATPTVAASPVIASPVVTVSSLVAPRVAVTAVVPSRVAEAASTPKTTPSHDRRLWDAVLMEAVYHEQQLNRQLAALDDVIDGLVPAQSDWLSPTARKATRWQPARAAMVSR